MVGIDVVDVSRIENIKDKSKLEERICSKTEIEYLQNKSKTAVSGKAFSEYTYSLSGLFASKEAFLKACGLGLGKVDVKEIVVLHKKSGEPYYEISNNIMDKLNLDGKQIYLSISHDAGVAIAICQITK